MTETRAYYTTPTDDPAEPDRHDVIVTTEHPLSSYGQPVVIDGDTAIPAQSLSHALHMYYTDAHGNDPARDLVAKANRLSGAGGETLTTAEQRAAFAPFFRGTAEHELVDAEDAATQTTADQLAALPVAEAMERANELCPESDRDQDWEEGATTWFFSDGSAYQACGGCGKALLTYEDADTPQD